MNNNLGQIDLNARPQKPQLFLCLPNRTAIAKLPEAYDVKQSLKLGGVNELSFAIPFDIDKQHELIRNPHVDILKERYLIKFVLGDQTEWYRLEKPADSMDDSGNIKRATCYSLAIELKDKQIRSYKKDAINAATALTDALSGSIWNTDYIDAEFLLTYRSFDVSKATVLDFVLQVATTFNALVIFDTVNRTVNFYKPENIGQNRGLKVSYGKYLKSLNRESDAGQIVTRLKVFGKDGMSIQRVNPTGANYIEDFSYFMYPFERDASRNVISHSDYMSDSLCNSLMDYAELLEAKDGDFTPLLSQKETLLSTLSTKQNELDTLNTELSTINDQIDIAQATGQPTSTLLSQKATKQSQINSKQSEINSVNSQITSVDSQIAALQSFVSMEENFTADQIMELNQFVVEDEWTDDNYIKDVDLYEEAKKKIQEINKPPLVINVDIVNFKEIVTEQRNWDKLNLGDTMTIAYEKFNLDAKAKIIGMDIEFDQANIQLTIADSKQVLDDTQKFLNTIYGLVSTSSTVDMSKFKWNGIETTQNDVSKLLNETWDAAKRSINGGVNESVTIDRRGITVTDSADPLKFLRLQHGNFGITSDGGNSYKQVINSSGIFAEELIGRIIAGEQLTIENTSGSFSVSSDGIVIRDSDFQITRTDGKTRILLNALDGIKVQQFDGDWIDKLYANTNGALTLEDLTVNRANITGANIVDAVISGQITWNSKPSYTASEVGAVTANQVTTITNDTIATTNVLANNLQVNAANINGLLSANQFEIKGKSVSDGTNTTFAIDNNGNVTINGNITMTGGSITWGAGGVNAPTAGQVGALPVGTYIPRTASDLDAKSASWLPTWYEISGEKPPINADNTYNYVTSKGMSYDPIKDVLTFNADNITAGRISANLIDTHDLAAERILQRGYPSNFAEIGGQFGDLILNNGGTEYFKIFNGIDYVDLITNGATRLTFASSDRTVPRGTWDFTNAEVKLPETVRVTAVFA